MNNDYSRKTTEQLAYIMQDAGRAAFAMRGVSDAAERKYLDQLNDATTEQYRRDAKLRAAIARKALRSALLADFLAIDSEVAA